MKVRISEDIGGFKILGYTIMIVLKHFLIWGVLTLCHNYTMTQRRQGKTDLCLLISTSPLQAAKNALRQ